MTSPRPNKRKRCRSGAPSSKTIKFMEEEKNLTPVTVKMGAITADYVKKHGGSHWVRKAVFMRLKKET